MSLMICATWTVTQIANLLVNVLIDRGWWWWFFHYQLHGSGVLDGSVRNTGTLGGDAAVASYW